TGVAPLSGSPCSVQTIPVAPDRSRLWGQLTGLEVAADSQFFIASATAANTAGTRVSVVAVAGGCVMAGVSVGCITMGVAVVWPGCVSSIKQVCDSALRLRPGDQLGDDILLRPTWGYLCQVGFQAIPHHLGQFVVCGEGTHKCLL